MNSSRTQLLARTCITGNEDTGIALRNQRELLDLSKKRLTLAYQLPHPQLFLDLH